MGKKRLMPLILGALVVAGCAENGPSDDTGNLQRRDVVKEMRCESDGRNCLVMDNDVSRALENEIRESWQLSKDLSREERLALSGALFSEIIGDMLQSSLSVTQHFNFLDTYLKFFNIEDGNPKRWSPRTEERAQ